MVYQSKGRLTLHIGLYNYAKMKWNCTCGRSVSSCISKNSVESDVKCAQAADNMFISLTKTSCAVLLWNRTPRRLSLQIGRQKLTFQQVENQWKLLENGREALCGHAWTSTHGEKHSRLSFYFVCNTNSSQPDLLGAKRDWDYWARNRLRKEHRAVDLSSKWHTWAAFHIHWPLVQWRSIYKHALLFLCDAIHVLN